MLNKFFGLYFNFSLLILVSFVTITFGEPIYGTTDDNILAGFVSGSYTGQKEFHLIFIQPIMGYFMFFLQLLVDSFDIYSWLLLLYVIISFTLLGNILYNNLVKTSNKKNVFILWMLLSSLTISWFTLNPTYTSASILVTTSSGIALFNNLFNSQNSLRKNNFKLIILSLFFTSGYLIRPEGFLGALILFTPFLLFLMIINRKLLFSKILLSLSVIFIVLFFNFLLSKYQNRNIEWASYNNWNNIRHQIQHRNSQNYLNLHLEANKWTIPEYHLFMDLAYGDPNVFNENWIAPAFKNTSYARGFDQLNFTNLKKAFFIVSSKLGENIYLLFIYIFLIFTVSKLINKNNKYLSILAIFLPLFISLFYMSVYLHSPDRVIQSILLIPVFLLFYLISIYNKANFKYKNMYLSIVITIFIYFYFSNNIITLNEANRKNIKIAQINREQLINFSSTAKFLGPGHTEIFNARNPYFSKAQERIPVYNTVGNWDTFSPHWFKRNKFLGFKDEMVYQNLFSKDVYWITNPFPETAYILELYLREKGNGKVLRSNIEELSTGLQIVRFQNGQN